MTDALSPCINCGLEVTTPYCAQCGQKNPPRKINVLMLYSDFQSRVLGFDGMFPRTLRGLTLRPGQVALEFVRGNRVLYVGPVGYFFMTLTTFVLLMQLLEIDFYQFSASNSPFMGEQTEGQKLVQMKFMTVVESNMRLFSFFQIPIHATFAWMIFRKNGYNFLEHAVLVFYSWGHLVWLSIIILLVYVFFQVSLNVWQLPVYVAFYGYACIGFYRSGSATKKFFKGALVGILALLLFVLLVTIAAAVYIFNDPDTMELLRRNRPQ